MRPNTLKSIQKKGILVFSTTCQRVIDMTFEEPPDASMISLNISATIASNNLLVVSWVSESRAHLLQARSATLLASNKWNSITVWLFCSVGLLSLSPADRHFIHSIIKIWYLGYLGDFCTNDFTSFLITSLTKILDLKYERFKSESQSKRLCVQANDAINTTVQSWATLNPLMAELPPHLDGVTWFVQNTEYIEHKRARLVFVKCICNAMYTC